MSKIKFNTDNAMQCLCTSCPVQEKSKCSANKKEIVDEKMNQMENSGEARGGMSMTSEEQQEEMSMEMQAPKPDEMPGLYCSGTIGKTNCADIDPSKQCTCPSCELWINNGLDSLHYCSEGDADQRG